MMHEMMQEKEEEIFRASLLCLPERMLCAAALLLAGLRHEGTELFTEEKRKSGEGGGREDLKEWARSGWKQGTGGGDREIKTVWIFGERHRLKRFLDIFFSVTS